MLHRVENIEQILDQGSGTLNEDNLACTENLFGVFDGASSLTAELFQGKSGAWWASHLASREFAKNNADLFELGSRANRQLQLQMTAMGVASTDRLQCWSTSAAVCRLRGDNVEWLQSGDCQVLAIDEAGECKLLSNYHNHDLPTLCTLKQLLDEGNPDPFRTLQPAIRKVRQQMNQSYGVLNGEPAALDFLFSGSAPVHGIRHLLIFTDGLLPPTSDPSGAPDFCWIGKHFLAGGLKKVSREIRQLEKTDPDCCRFPRFKQHDDIAALAISFAG